MRREKGEGEKRVRGRREREGSEREKGEGEKMVRGRRERRG